MDLRAMYVGDVSLELGQYHGHPNEYDSDRFILILSFTP